MNNQRPFSAPSIPSNIDEVQMNKKIW